MYDHGHQDRRVTVRFTFKEYERYMELPGHWGAWRKTISDVIRQALKDAVKAQDAARETAFRMQAARAAQSSADTSDADRCQTNGAPKAAAKRKAPRGKGVAPGRRFPAPGKRKGA